MKMLESEENLGQRLDEACQNPEFCAALLGRLKDTLGSRTMRFMEVCGTHTISIFQSGLRSLLPKNIIHLSGPGCPVCVTHDAEVALFTDLALQKNLIIATFGDLMRVPDPEGRSLKHASAAGAKIATVYSPLDAVTLARDNPESEVVFLGAGFETTAPTTAGAILTAAKLGLGNFSVFSMHKLVPPALHALLNEADNQIDAFLLPGHVAVITGFAPFLFLRTERRLPAAIGGFAPADILLALCAIADQLAANQPEVANAYPRAVAAEGNPRARTLMEQVFEPCNAMWRGLGQIPQSGLAIRSRFSPYDAMKKFDLSLPETRSISGCRCGDVLKGKIQPPQCGLFGNRCTPAQPVGPCMVSTEGSCSAYYKYGKI